jgi:hypothetical protein
MLSEGHPYDFGQIEFPFPLTQQRDIRGPGFPSPAVTKDRLDWGKSLQYLCCILIPFWTRHLTFVSIYLLLYFKCVEVERTLGIPWAVGSERFLQLPCDL